MVFYIRYANLECKVSAPLTWYKYFFKLYEYSDILSCSKKSLRSSLHAAVTIEEVKSKDIYLRFQVDPGLKKYYIEASNAPLFLFPSTHQFISRIFNILFHLSGGFVLHASSILVDDKAYVFVGGSGRGKSTIVDLIKKEVPESYILSDNSAFILKKSGKFYIYPSPYLEANRMECLQTKFAKPPPYYIQKTLFTYPSKKNTIKNIPFTQKIKLIQLNSHIPYSPKKIFNKDQLANYGKTIFLFIDKVKIDRLEFSREKSALSSVLIDD